VDWGELARAQHGAIAREQLRAAGITDTTTARMLGRGELSYAAARVFLVRGAPLTYRAQLFVAVLSTGGRLGFATAGRLWNVTESDGGRVHVVVPHARRIYPPAWVAVHRVPVPTYAATTLDGLPVTTRSWTVLDLLGTLPPSERMRLADRALQREWIQPRHIGRRLHDFPGRTGNLALRLVAQQLDDGAAAQSERVLHRLLRQIGLSDWEPNYRLWVDGQLVAVIDLALPQRRIAIEVDGWAYHSDVDRFRRDRSRQNDLVLLGWTVLRFTWADLIERPGYVRRSIARAAA
jgi:very-short-patch-repair endonuclease